MSARVIIETRPTAAGFRADAAEGCPAAACGWVVHSPSREDAYKLLRDEIRRLVPSADFIHAAAET